VSYADGTTASVEQMAADVATFLAWASEPELETRKRMGTKVILYMLVLTGFLYAIKRRVWSAVH
jgi:ubiquinol-cytochrome c reductase cytochrome c1 subunit